MTRRRIILSYDPADLPDHRDGSWVYDFERNLTSGKDEAESWGVPIRVEFEGPNVEYPNGCECEDCEEDQP